MSDYTSPFRSIPSDYAQQGLDQEAVGANPAPRPPIQPPAPIWKSFVQNSEFEKANKSAIAAEQQQMRAEDSRARQGDIFRGKNGLLVHKAPGQRAVGYDANEWTDHPIAGPEARKSLWDKEIRTNRQEAEETSLRLQNPAFHAQELKDKDREDMLAEGKWLQQTNPRHIELKAKLAADDDYRTQKADMSQRAWDAKARASRLESMDPEAWWQERQAQPAPTQTEQRQATVQSAQAKQAEAKAADDSWATDFKSINDKLIGGVTGEESKALQEQRAEMLASRPKIAEEATAAAQQVEGVKQEAKATVERGFIDNALTAVKRGYAGAAQAANVLQGATDQTNAEDIARHEATKRANPASKEFQDFMQAEGFAASAAAFIKNPVRIISEVMAESAAQMVPSMALGVAGGAIGGALTSTPTGGAAAPATVPIGAVIGGAVGAGSGSALSEYGSSMMQSMEDAGMDATKPESIKAFFSDPEKVAKAREFAINRGVAVGIFDGVSAGLAGKFMKPVQTAFKAGEKVGVAQVLAATGKEVALQAGTGATGEVAGQVASTGTIKDGKSVFLEGIAEIGSAPVEVASNLREFRHKDFKKDSPEAPAILEEVNTSLAALGQATAPATENEVFESRFIGRDTDTPADVAELVLVQRDLAAIAEEDAQILPAAQEALAQAQATGDKGSIKVAETALEQATAAPARAPLVTATLKIAAGKDLTALEPEELAAIGYEESKGEVQKDENGNEFIPTEFKRIESPAGANAKPTPQMIAEGRDGSLIITQTALDAVAAASPRARARIKMKASEAIEKANARAQQVSTGSENGAEGELQTGLPASAGRVPIETNPPVEFDVPMRDGHPVRVQATTADQAEQEAASMFEAGTNAVLPGQAAPVQPAAAVDSSPAGVSNGPTGDPAAGFPSTGVEGLSPSETGTPAEELPPTNNENTNGQPNIRVGDSGNQRQNDRSGQQGQSQQGASSDANNREKPEDRPSQLQNEGGGASLQPEVGNIQPGIQGRSGTGIESPQSDNAASSTTRVTATAKARAIVAKAKKNKSLAARLIEGEARAEVSPDGATATVNPQAIIEEALNLNMTEDEAVGYFSRILDEEIRHLAQYDAARMLFNMAGKPGGKENFSRWMAEHYTGIWQSEFAGTEKEATVRDLYLRSEEGDAAEVQAAWDAMSESAKSLEAIRMMSQGENVTEAAKLWMNIGKELRNALKAALVSLKKFADTASPEILQEIKNLENALSQLTGTPVASYPDARNRPEKPNKRSKDTGTAQPAEEELPSEPASGGRAEQGGREAPSPSSWKGKRVEFVQDGVTLKGTVAAFATVPKHGTFLSVKLDDGFKGAPTRGIYIDELTNSKGDQISGFREIGVAPEKGPETKAEKKIKPPAPAEAEAPPATEPKSEEPEFKIPTIDGLLSSILDEIKGWVNTGTGGGARSMDRNWERGAIKRYLSSSSLMTTLIDGKQSGKTATAKVNIGKATTFAEIIAAVEKLRSTEPVAKTTESQQVAPDVSPSVTDEVAADDTELQDLIEKNKKFLTQANHDALALNRLKGLLKGVQVSTSSKVTETGETASYTVEASAEVKKMKSAKSGYEALLNCLGGGK